jgi:DNA repair protein RadC
VLLTLLQDEPAEVFAILRLTTKHRVIAYQEVSRGTLDAALVTPREVCQAARTWRVVTIGHVRSSKTVGVPASIKGAWALTSRLDETCYM